MLARLAKRRHAIAADLRERAPASYRGSVFAARGSSRNAAMFGCHMLSTATATPSCIASLSVESTPGTDIDYEDWLSISISQSGRTPEIVSSLKRHLASHARACAVTNDENSPLAGAAEIKLVLDAGPERAVPATK
ncbi:MAG: SIS domain-containing protein, partial [Ilumatobacter sp.]